MGSDLKLRWYLLGTSIATFILFGVSGGFVWAVSAIAAWLIVRSQPSGSRNYVVPFIIWCVMIMLMWWGGMVQTST